MNYEDDLARQARVERTERELIAVLERYTRVQDNPPTFDRAIAFRCLVDLVAGLMLTEIRERGEAARPELLLVVRQLELVIMPKPTTTTH